MIEVGLGICLSLYLLEASRILGEAIWFEISSVEAWKLFSIMVNATTHMEGSSKNMAQNSQNVQAVFGHEDAAKLGDKFSGLSLLDGAEAVNVKDQHVERQRLIGASLLSHTGVQSSGKGLAAWLAPADKLLCMWCLLSQYTVYLEIS